MQILIAGGGIGGLTAALMLHRLGHRVNVFEQTRELRPLGVGINLLPHAVGILADLGLLDELKASGVEASEYVFMNEFGQTILSDPRVKSAGYTHPQLSIHRGELQMLLFHKAMAELGPDRLRLGRRLVSFEQTEGSVRATFTDSGRSAQETVQGDILIGADGIHSVIRARFYPREGLPRWSGATMWRGATQAAPFLSGSSVIKAGWTDQKFVAYPISKQDPATGKVLVNWIANLRTGGDSLPDREDWNKPGRLEDFLPRFEKWHFSFLDVPAMIRATPSVYEFPMVDRDPIDRWSFGRVTLLGDAAHPMYPIASNGATQAVLDAKALSEALAAAPQDAAAALTAYEGARLAPTAKIIAMNRENGPDVILDMVRDRAPNGFAQIDDVVPASTLRAVVQGYKTSAGHRQGELAQAS